MTSNHYIDGYADSLQKLATLDPASGWEVDAIRQAKNKVVPNIKDKFNRRISQASFNIAEKGLSSVGKARTKQTAFAAMAPSVVGGMFGYVGGSIGGLPGAVAASAAGTKMADVASMGTTSNYAVNSLKRALKAGTKRGPVPSATAKYFNTVDQEAAKAMARRKERRLREAY